MDKICIIINGVRQEIEVDTTDVVEITLMDADEPDDGDNEYAYIQRQPYYGWRLHDDGQHWRVLQTHHHLGAPELFRDERARVPN